MIREEQTSEISEQQIQQDFPGCELGTMLCASYEDRCWYLLFRLHQGQDTLDVHDASLPGSTTGLGEPHSLSTRDGRKTDGGKSGMDHLSTPPNAERGT